MNIGTVALVTQWVGTLLTFGLFLFLWQSMPSPLLRYWTLGWLSLTIALLALAMAFSRPSLEVPFETIYFFGEYCFAFFLVAGCRHLIGVSAVSRRSLLWLAAGFTAAVTWSLIASDFNVQFLPHAAVFACCFVAAFRILAPARRARRGGGIRVMSLALVLLAVDFFHDVPAIAYALRVGPARQPSYLRFNSIIDMVFEVLLGFGMVMVMFDSLLHDVREANAKLEDRARTDPLTNALNRHAYHTLVDQGGRGMSGCVAVVDVDGLKTINDQQGHAAGDLAIRRVASAIRAAIRADDLVFRWGGDEFLVVLSNVAEEEAARRFDAIPGVSFGLTSFGPGHTLDQAIERADSLMYAKKKSRDVRGVRG